MSVIQALYYAQDNQNYYLHLDSSLRQIPDNTTLQNLYGTTITSSSANIFNSASSPYPIGLPLPSGTRQYTLGSDTKTIYLGDAFPWNLQQLVLRKIVNQTQLNLLGFSVQPVSWSGSTPPTGVPIAIHSGQNWHLQTFISGYYIVYNHLCHPENPINPYFKTWLDNNFSKAEVKSRIIQTQHQIDALNGEIPVLAPRFSPIGGIQNTPTVPVTISCPTPNAIIYYSINGTDPLPTPTYQYTGPVSLDLSNGSLTLKAIAECPDSIGTSPLEKESYFYTPIDVAKPAFNPAAGQQTNRTINVHITCSTPGVIIYYTTDGTNPIKGQNPYSGPIALDLSQSNQTIKAIAVINNNGSSDVSSATYSFEPPIVAPPTFNPAGGTYIEPYVKVNISCNTPNAALFYTTDGTTPSTSSSPSFSTPVRLEIASSSKTIKAIGSLPDATNSAIAESTYSCSKAWNHCWRLADSAIDITGNLTLNSSNVTYTSTNTGDTAVFSGNSQLTSNSPENMKSAVFTVAVWAKATTMPPQWAAIWIFENNQNGNTNGPGLFLYNDGHIQSQTRQSDNHYVFCNTNPGTISANVWNHYVLVAGSDKVLRLYINGNQVKSANFDGTLSTNDCALFSVGAEYGPSYGFTGQIKKLYYINSALTSQEIMQLYLAG